MVKLMVNKIIRVILMLSSIAVIVLAMMQIFQVWEQAINVYMPLLGIVNLCQAYIHWKKNRTVAFLSIGVAAFIFVCAGVILFLK